MGRGGGSIENLKIVTERYGRAKNVLHSKLHRARAGGTRGITVFVKLVYPPSRYTKKFSQTVPSEWLMWRQTFHGPFIARGGATNLTKTVNLIFGS